MAGRSAAQEILTVETPESVAFAYELAGLGSRGVALALDMLMIGLISLAEAAFIVLAGVVIRWAVSPEALTVAIPWLAGALLLSVFATAWAYFVYGEVVRNGRTWGKSRVGLRVVRDDGSRVGALDSVIRNLLRVVDALPGNYAVGMLCILFNARCKRLGDMAAGTVVVRDRGDLVLRFDGGESEAEALAREFLERRAKLTPAARSQVGTAIMAAFGEELSPSWDEAAIAGRLAELCGWSAEGAEMDVRASARAESDADRG